MTDEEFSQLATEALEDLENRLNELTAEHPFELDAGGGTLKIIFEEPVSATFVISANAPARQIWIAARVQSFKFDYDAGSHSWREAKSREEMKAVVGRLIGEQLQLGSPIPL